MRSVRCEETPLHRPLLKLGIDLPLTAASLSSGSTWFHILMPLFLCSFGVYDLPDYLSGTDYVMLRHYNVLSDPRPTHQDRLTLGHPHPRGSLYPQRAVNLGHPEREDKPPSLAVEMVIVPWR